MDLFKDAIYKPDKKQKFQSGDIVWINVKSPGMSHFKTKQFAIVNGTYAQVCRTHHGGEKENHKIYDIQLVDNGEGHAWYNEKDLRLATENEIVELKLKEKV